MGAHVRAGDEIKSLRDHVADKYDVRRHMRSKPALEGVQGGR